MNSEDLRTVSDIVERENQKSGNVYNPRRITAMGHKTPSEMVDDSAAVFYLAGFKTENDSILTISNSQFPDSVDMAVQKIKTLVSVLEPWLNKHILRPSQVGRFGSRSYAIWPRHQPISGNKLIRRAQIGSIHSSLVSWVNEVGHQSSRPVISREELSMQFLEPLAFLLDEESLSEPIKSAANRALESIDNNSFTPVSVVQHGDFWYGNILLERTWPFSLASDISFYVIDWAGAIVRGYPFIDLLRYCQSTGAGKKKIAQCLNAYASHCNIRLADMELFACAYAGHLGMNRGEFPMHRYLQLIGALLDDSRYFSKQAAPGN